jgi:hypothetical protein
MFLVRQNPFSELSLSYDIQEMCHDFATSWGDGKDAALEWVERRARDGRNLETAAQDAFDRRPDTTDPDEREMLGGLISDAYRRRSCDAVFQKLLGAFSDAVEGSSGNPDQESTGVRVNRAVNFEANVIIKLLFNEWRDHGKSEVKKRFINRDEAEFVREILANEHTSNWTGNISHDQALEKIVLTEKDGKTSLTMPAAMLLEILEIEQRFDTYKGRHM